MPCLISEAEVIEVTLEQREKYFGAKQKYFGAKWKYFGAQWKYFGAKAEILRSKGRKKGKTVVDISAT